MVSKQLLDEGLLQSHNTQNTICRRWNCATLVVYKGQEPEVSTQDREERLRQRRNDRRCWQLWRERSHLPKFGTKITCNLPASRAGQNCLSVSDDAATDVMVTPRTLCDRFWRQSVSNCHSPYPSPNHAIACSDVLVLQAFRCSKCHLPCLSTSLFIYNVL